MKSHPDPEDLNKLFPLTANDISGNAVRPRGSCVITITISGIQEIAYEIET